MYQRFDSVRHVMRQWLPIAALTCAVGTSNLALAQQNEIVIDDKRAFPESMTSTSDGTINLPRELWQTLERERFISPDNQMPIRSSLTRLQSLGFGAEIQTMESVWIPRFVVLPEGEKFLQRLRDVAE